MHKKKILIVDDDIFNQEVLELRLDDFDVECTMLNNGQEAVDYMKTEQHVDLIFMDINMPILDGIQATILIREYEKETSKKRIPIVAAGASIDQSDKGKLLLDGMDDIIIKPISQEALEEVLDKFLFFTNNFTYDIEKISKGLGVPVDMIQNLLDQFVRLLDDELFEMMGMAQKEDFQALQNLAHKLKGRSGNFQLMQMYEIFGSIEKSAKEHIKIDYEKSIDELYELNEKLKKL